MSRKPTLLFVDHDFHRKTRSFDFLTAILAESFDVRMRYIDPTLPPDPATLIDDSTYVVIAQMDFLTPLFIAAGKRVVVVQMYDGSGGLPDTHWELNRQARYLNFSVTLHARALALGAKSHLVRYFPDPARFSEVTDFSTLRGFFWQRKPKSGIDLPTVRRMLGDQLDTLHVHTPTDDGSAFDPADLDGFDCPVTQSDWFEKPADFAAVMDRCNVFVAPRHAEGIGHAFLEAMARGMLVLAYALPTHDEYIANWTNGILFDAGQGSIDLRGQIDRMARIGAAARLGTAIGHAEWRKSHAGLNAFVRDTEPAQVPAQPGLQQAIAAIMAAYQQDQPSYVAALNRYPETRRTLGGWRDFAAELQAVPPAGAAQDSGQDGGQDSGLHIFFGAANVNRFVVSGWSVEERSHRWAIAPTATLEIPLTADVSVTGLRIRARSLGPCQLKITINGQDCGGATLDTAFSLATLTFAKPVRLRRDAGLTLRFAIDPDIRLPNVEPRPLTFALKSLDLTCAPGPA